MLAIKSGSKCTSTGKKMKGAICVKVFDPPFVYTLKILSEVKSQIFPIIYLLLHILEFKKVFSSIHELGIITSVLWKKPTRICNSPVPDLPPVRAPPPRPLSLTRTWSGGIWGQSVEICTHSWHYQHYREQVEPFFMGTSLSSGGKPLKFPLLIYCCLNMMFWLWFCWFTRPFEFPLPPPLPPFTIDIWGQSVEICTHSWHYQHYREQVEPFFMGTSLSSGGKPLKFPLLIYCCLNMMFWLWFCWFTRPFEFPLPPPLPPFTIDWYLTDLWTINS